MPSPTSCTPFLPSGSSRSATQESGSSGRKESATRRPRSGKLTKPSPAAWLANLLVRTRPQLVDELLGLGDALRRAQRRGAGDAIRTLSARRQELVRQLGRVAGEGARAAGHKLGASHERQLEETLEAAVADASIASELREGRLTRAMAHVGFGDELADRRPLPSRPRSRPRTGRDAPVKAEPDDRGEQHRRAAARADAALVKARADLLDAERVLDQARRRHDTATATRRQVAKALKEAERELRASSVELGRLEQRRRRASAALGKAERQRGHLA